jgi:hypothetical protein
MRRWLFFSVAAVILLDCFMNGNKNLLLPDWEKTGGKKAAGRGEELVRQETVGLLKREPKSIAGCHAPFTLRTIHAQRHAPDATLWFDYLAKSHRLI